MRNSIFPGYSSLEDFTVSEKTNYLCAKINKNTPGFQGDLTGLLMKHRIQSNSTEVFDQCAQ